jgi:hypothetical protein
MARGIGQRGSGFEPVAVTIRSETLSSTWRKPSNRRPLGLDDATQGAPVELHVGEVLGQDVERLV